MAQVDPVLKGDLNIVKAAFEKGAQTQPGAATYVPFRGMISSTRQIHENVRAAVARYPSVYAKDSPKSLIDTVQQECIPCAGRLKVLKGLDISFDLDLMLGNYNKNTLTNLVEFFKHLKGQTPIERNICEAFAALRANCVPDVKRLVAVMTLTISEIRNVDIPHLHVSFLGVVFSILSKITVGYTTGFDKYTRLITDTIRCNSNDLKTQLAKLDPILSPGGRNNAAQAFKNAWSKNEAGKNWTRNNANSTPVYNANAFNKIDKATRASTEAIDKVQNATADFKASADNKTKNVMAVLDGVFNLCSGRVELNLDGALQDLLKMLKSNDSNLDVMNTLLQQVQTIMGAIALCQALVSSDARQKYDACGPDRGRKFFNDITLPDRKIFIVPPPPESGRPADDVDIVITSDPIQVDNPIVRDILEQSGIAIRAINTGTSGSVVTGTPGSVAGSSVASQAEDIAFIVDSEPITINFFACMKKTLGQ